MPISDLVETARSIRQSYLEKGRRNPAELIGQDTADVFNRLLEGSKNRCPEHPFIRKMQPVHASRTQFGGLLTKVGLLEDSLKSEQSRLRRLIAESG